MERAPSTNKGIVDGRPEGRQLKGSSVLLDTVVDRDASADDNHPLAQCTIPGATSRDVYRGIGAPVQGMSSKELRHDGQPGRKRQGRGTEQFGGDTAEGSRRIDDASEKRWIAGKTEFRD